MDRMAALSRLNPDLAIFPITSQEFSAYGRIVTGLHIDREVKFARESIKIGTGVVYDASVPGLEEAGRLRSELEEKCYGQMPIELGWCYGHNISLDGLEYHKGNEIDVAVTDCLVMLALFNDIHWEEKTWIDSTAVKTFFVPAGTVFEFYSWGLHFAPLHASDHEGFCTLVALPRETNFPLKQKPDQTGESALLFGRNKWLIVHPEAAGLIKDGAYPGIRGKNLKLNPLP